MKIYVTAPFKWQENKSYIEDLCQNVKLSWFKDYCFIRDGGDYKGCWNPYEMMQSAKKQIISCDALLIDYDGPGSGLMIELGMAYSFNKKILLITKKGINIRSTVKGVTDAIIEYTELKDIIDPMKRLLLKWGNNKI